MVVTTLDTLVGTLDIPSGPPDMEKVVLAEEEVEVGYQEALETAQVETNILEGTWTQTGTFGMSPCAQGPSMKKLLGMACTLPSDLSCDRWKATYYTWEQVTLLLKPL